MVQSVARGIHRRRRALQAALLAPALLPAVLWGASPSRTLLVVGDSLSAEYGLPRGSGWVSLLAQRIDRERAGWSVVNASISGETTAGGRSRLADLLARHRPDLVVIELGGNDALRGLPLDRSESNLREMIVACRRTGAAVVLFGMQMPPNYGRAYREAFSSMYQRLAQVERIALLPFFLAPIADRIDAFQSDRIHPTAEVQIVLLDHAWTVLGPLLRPR